MTKRKASSATVDPTQVYLTTKDMVDYQKVCDKFRQAIEPEVVKASRKALAIERKRIGDSIDVSTTRRFVFLGNLLKHELDLALLRAAPIVQAEPIRKKRSTK